MKTILNLVHLQLDNQYAFLKAGRKGIVKLILPIAIIAFALLTLKTFIDIFFLQFQGLGININQSLLTIILAFLALLSLILALSKIISTLYLSKDNEILMSFPATHKEIFFSKMISIYIHEVIVNAMFSCPILLWYKGAAQQSNNFNFYLLIYLLIMPMFYITLAGLISIPVMMLIKILKKRFILSIVLIVISCASVIALYISLVSKISFTFNIVDFQVSEIIKFNAWVYRTGASLGIFNFLSDFLSGHQFVWRLLVMIALIICFGAISLVIVQIFYFNLAMIASESGQAKIQIIREYKQSSPLSSLLKKEALMIMRNPNYVFQYFLFTLLMPFVVVAYNQLLKDITITQVGKSMVFASHVLIMAIFTMLSNLVSANLISLEGPNYYLIKTTPISYHLQIFAKVLFNFITTAIAVVLTSIAVIVFLQMNPFYVIISSIAILIAALGHICLNIEMDLRKPALSWYDANEITAISRTLTKAILYAFLIGIIIGAYMFISGDAESIITYIILLILVSAFTAFRLYCLYFRTVIFLGRNEI